MTMSLPAFRPASRLAGITVSPILGLSQRAREMNAEGRSVIDLTVGEPDFDTADRIKAAAVAALKAGRTRYTALTGAADLLDAIVVRMRQAHGLDVARNQIIACSGAKQVIHNALAASLDEADEVILPCPYWTSYADMIALEGGVPVAVPGMWDPARGWRLDLAALEQAITPRTRWLLLNFPGNPSGSVLDADERAALAALLARRPQVWLLCDDIYEDLVYDAARAPPLAAEFPDLAPRTLIVGGVSKAHAMTGWRLGWGVGPAPLVAAMAKVQSQTTSAPSSISQAAAVEALSGPQDAVAAMVDRLRVRRDATARALNAVRGFVCPVPQGAFYLLPDVAALLGARTPDGQVLADDLALSAYLLEAAEVAAVPGSVFGAPGSLRLSFAASDEALAEACRRIDQACARLTLAARAAEPAWRARLA